MDGLLGVFAMNGDGLDIQEFLKIPQAERNKAWLEKPPVAAAVIVVEKPVAPKEVTDFKKNKTANRIARMKQNLAATTIPDNFRRWDPRQGKFVDERVEQ